MAGGESRRFGSAKPLALLCGQTLAERLAGALAGVVGRVVAVAPHSGSLAETGLALVPDLLPGRGPLSGVHAALTAAREEGCRGVLAVACDLPLVPRELLRLLAAGAAAHPRPPLAPESRGPRGFEPLCACWPVSSLDRLEAYLVDGGREAAAFFRESRGRLLPLSQVERIGDPEVIFLNVNTPADLERAREALKQREPRR
ncbi:MAG: molybdenum cofactor guanylyltransferase [Longimicrobiaceae bacterium]